jgi:hypothetical protein
MNFKIAVQSIVNPNKKGFFDMDNAEVLHVE